MKKRRLCISPQDISIITGKCSKSSRELLHTIKAHLKKEKHQFVTFKEFAEYTGIPTEEIEKF